MAKLSEWSDWDLIQALRDPYLADYERRGIQYQNVLGEALARLLGRTAALIVTVDAEKFPNAPSICEAKGMTSDQARWITDGCNNPVESGFYFCGHCDVPVPAPYTKDQRDAIRELAIHLRIKANAAFLHGRSKAEYTALRDLSIEVASVVRPEKAPPEAPDFNRD